MKFLPSIHSKKPQPSDYTKLWNQISAKHLHVSFEILIQLSGKIQNTINGSTQLLIPGNVVLMRPGDEHTIDVPPKETHLHRDIYISPAKMKKMCDFLSPELFRDLTKSPEPIYFDIDANKMHTLENKLFLFNEKDFDSFDYESMHSCICFNLLSDYFEHNVARKKAYPDWLQKFLIFLNNPEHIPLKIDELTKFTNYSREHLSRIFKKYLGQTLESYIIDMRMNYSLQLLSDTDFSLVYIANELGYDSQNSFTNNFRNRFGVTPKEWRQKRVPPPCDRNDKLK